LKRTGNLWPALISFENLHLAARLTLKGKRTTAGACLFHTELEHNLLCLQRELVAERYVPGGYRTFWINDPKRRMISVAPFRDRVVHHALVQVLEPVFENRFIHHSYACRVGRGTHAALDTFRKWVRGRGYLLKMDVRKFFPSLDHEILKLRIRAAIKDPHVVGLCDRLIDASNPQERIIQHFPGDSLLTPLYRRVGLPIGNLTSQFFGNVYLDRLDQHVTAGLGAKRYLRYGDDFVICHRDKAYLRDLRPLIAECLGSLRLRLNEGKSRVRQLKEGVEFLGFVHFPDRTRLRPENLRRMRRRLRRLLAGHASGELDFSRDVVPSLQSWNAHAAYGDTWRLRKDVFEAASFVRR